MNLQINIFDGFDGNSVISFGMEDYKQSNILNLFFNEEKICKCTWIKILL